jgi:type III pantothenate kinase
MLLALDVGNTETTVGLFDGDAVKSSWRLTTATDRTPDELLLLVRSLLQARGIDASSVGRAGIASVVPPLTQSLAEACTKLGAETVVIDGSSRLPIRLAVDEPLTVGADRIVNTLAASSLFARDTIVVDLGTATTFDCITADGVFLGGVIAPGVRTAMETLVRRTSKLPATELALPARAIGRRTEECIRAGVMFGAADSIDGIVKRIKAEWPGDSAPLVVATGGLAPLLEPMCLELERVELDLTLQGIRLAVEHLTG